jgi:hypothetical protein
MGDNDSSKGGASSLRTQSLPDLVFSRLVVSHPVRIFACVRGKF